MIRNILITLIFLLILAGCGTLNSVRKTIFADPTIDGEDKIEYAKIVEEKEGEFREYKETNKTFMPFHYAGIILIVGGFVLAAFGSTTKDEGATAILCGFALSAWALIAPKFIGVVAFVLGAFILLIIGFVIYEMVKGLRK